MEAAVRPAGASGVGAKHGENGVRAADIELVRAGDVVHSSATIAAVGLSDSVEIASIYDDMFFFVTVDLQMRFARVRELVCEALKIMTPEYIVIESLKQDGDGYPSEEAAAQAAATTVGWTERVG